MKRVGETLRERHPEITVRYDPDYLRGLPPTEVLRAGLAPIAARLAGLETPSLRLLVERGRFERAIAAAEERDRLQAGRPAGCWCLGIGGSGERAAIRPDASGTVVLGKDGAESVAFAPEDVVTFLARYCDCPEGAARRAREDALRREMATAYRRSAEARALEDLWRGTGVPARFRGCTLETYPGRPETAAAIGGWLDGPDWGLVLTGPFGTGKTGLAVGVIAQATERHIPALFVKERDLLAKVRATYDRDRGAPRRSEDGATEADVIASLRSVPLLVYDDAGTDKESDWAKSLLFAVLDHRHDEQRKTLVTTNLGPGQLEHHLGTRTMERFNEGAAIVRVDGPNLRRETAA